MWNDSYKDYVKELVKTNYKEYPYYIAHTCTYWGINNTAVYPSFKVYFSKEPIQANDLYNYTLKGDSLCYSVIGGNGNQNYHDSRVTTANALGNVKINDYEFIYTNAEFTGSTVQPDILATTSVSQSHFDAVGLIILAILLGSVVVKILKH